MSSLHAPARLSGSIAEDILSTAAALRKVCPGAEPIAFWDFDGTLFEGDCSEGFTSSDASLVSGLVELAMDAGLSRQYPAERGFADFWKDYQHLMRTDGYIPAYLYLASAFTGAPEAALRDLAAQEFAGRLRPWFFREALELWQELEAGGVRCVVISASPDFFVKGAAAVLGAPLDRLYGLRANVTEEGILTDSLVPPLSVGAGKADLLSSILAEAPTHGPGTRFAIAAFGNDFFNDGPMLDAVAHTVLPAGQPVAALVNAPPLPPGAGPLRRITFQGRK